MGNHGRRHRNSTGMFRDLWLCILLGIAWVGKVALADGSQIGERRMLVCGKRTAIVAFSPRHPQGVVEWTYPVNSREGWVLPDGNVLLAVGKGSLLPTGETVPGGAAIEICRGAAPAADRIVWRYDGTQAEVNSIQKTAAGTYVLTEAGPTPRLLELAADRTVVTEFALACQQANVHMQTRMARKQTDGSFLVPHLLDCAIIRYASDGTVLQRIDTRVPGEPKINSWPFTAIALADGGILAGLTHANRVVEFDADGKIRWQVTAADTDGAISDACGVQRLPGGTTMIASYRIGPGGERMLEVTPDRKVVWVWKDTVPAVHHFHLFESDGVMLPAPPLR
jgi:outer membrane protein assembly factor BamB